MLTTDRLVLEPWSERHRESFRQIAADPEVMRYIGDGRRWSSERADEVFDDELSHWAQHNFGWRSALDRDSGEWLGFIGLNYAPPVVVELAADEVEIGWWIARSAWGQGLASEGATAVRDEAFGRVGLERIVAGLQPANLASARVAERIGLKYARERTGRHGERVAIYALCAPPSAGDIGAV